MLTEQCLEQCEARRLASEKSEKTRYIVAHDGEKTYYAIKVEAGQVVHSGLPFLELFDTEKEAVKKFPNVSFTEVDNG